MSYVLSSDKAKALFSELKKEYKIIAPKRFPAQGRFSATDIIRYAEVDSFDEIELKEKSDYPAKEAISPIQQAIFYFTEDEFRASKGNTKPVLLFARPCDINAQHVQAQIYAGNGGFVDMYYQRMRELVKFVLMECPASDDTCFCVSMGTNKTDDYSMAVHVGCDGSMSFKVQDEALESYFAGAEKSDFEPAFVEENETKVRIPEIPNKEVVNKLKADPMWRQFDKRCISCGACTIACSTCTCFTTRDVVYGDNPEVGERRRVASSCQIADFSTVAGGGSYRNNAGDRMRYKMLHKFHDYKARFGDQHMCVGCGRCISRCPEFISITHTLEKMYDAVEAIKAETAGK